MTSSPLGDDLRLTISPYGYIEWHGPRARIEATGLLPANFKWPARIDYAGWHADGFQFWLRRCRPDGLMGPMRSLDELRLLGRAPSPASPPGAHVAHP